MSHEKRALVTGGAGLIGSHVTDHLIREGWTVRILDNLEPQTHRLGKPAWINEKAEFVQGDLTDRATIRAAMEGIDVIFHQGAYGGYMPEIAKYVYVNSFGTAQMLEVIREDNLPIKKIVVASSQAVYSEGAATCPTHGLVFPAVRPVEQLRRGDWTVHCPQCGADTVPAPTPEEAPVGGETVYGLTKVDQEKLVLLWGKQYGVPTVALRYSCTFGPRQSIFNPYTGVIAIFCTRILNGLPPVLFEDGEQTRDFRSWRTSPARIGWWPNPTGSTGCRSTWAAAGAWRCGKWPSRFQPRSAATSRRRSTASSVPARCGT